MEHEITEFDQTSIMDELEGALEAESLYRRLCVDMQTENELLEKENELLHQVLESISSQAHKLIMLEIESLRQTNKED